MNTAQPPPPPASDPPSQPTPAPPVSPEQHAEARQAIQDFRYDLGKAFIVANPGLKNKPGMKNKH